MKTVYTSAHNGNVEKISVEFSITAEKLGKRFEVRKSIRHIP